MAMAVPKELQTLAQVASEVDESEIKITFANQCIKAQESLANKLKEEIQRRKEICNSKKNENTKLEAEIKNAELEIENLRVTYKTIKTTNTEMQKELHLTKEKKAEITERISKGEKKYEDLWIKCKERYENIPLVKLLMQNKSKCEDLKNSMNVLDNEAQTIENEIKNRKTEQAEKDKKQIIQLAEFLVHGMPAAVKTIKEKVAMINDLNKEIENIKKEIEEKDTKVVASIANKESVNKRINKDDWSIDNTLMMPRLQLPSVDMDICMKLDINKVTLHPSPVKRTISLNEIEKNTTKITKTDEILKDNYISCYFNKSANTEDDVVKTEQSVNYSKKKLINIIEDIKIDDSETFKLVANANIDKFQEVSVITATRNAQDYIKSSKTFEIEEVEEIDLTKNTQEKILNPPSQFLDLSQDKNNESIQKEVQADVHMEVEEDTAKRIKLSHPKELYKKKVSFELSVTTPEETDMNLEDSAKVEVETPNETVTSQLDLSDVNDDNYMAIKDMILKKKHQLNLSPQFVYAKNPLQKKSDEQIVTSKFFESNQKSPDGNTTLEDKTVNSEREQEAQKPQDQPGNEKNPEQDNLVDMGADNAVSSPEHQNAEKPVTGLLFTHGAQGITDLDISMSTNGYEDGDQDFPTCLDGSLLLSPKAEIPAMSGNSEGCSQDLPGFLTGFRKAGLSFFKQNPLDANADSSKQNQGNNFSFNFGSDDKKSKGGLFSFFR